MSDQIKGLIFWLAYFSPSIVGFIRKVEKPWALLLLNALAGWTIVGWFMSWTYVFPWARALFQRFIIAIAGGTKAAGGGPGPMNAAADGSQAQRTCPNGANGRMTCRQCQGKGSWYQAPTTATGTAELARCSYCSGSGNVQCTVCGGSGRVF
jgi:Superinfection immunity protein